MNSRMAILSPEVGRVNKNWIQVKVFFFFTTRVTQVEVKVLVKIIT